VTRVSEKNIFAYCTGKGGNILWTEKGEICMVLDPCGAKLFTAVTGTNFVL
jgi:hypothetical protein